jgi:hypothetical protein
MNYEIKIALYPFTCPVTGKQIKAGHNYAELEGMAVSLEAVLPKRNLKKIDHHGSN